MHSSKLNLKSSETFKYIKIRKCIFPTCTSHKQGKEKETKEKWRKRPGKGDKENGARK